MKHIITNQKGFSGSILIAISAIIIALIATVTFMSIIEADTNSVTLMQDKIQQSLFLRSEVKRINIMLERSTTYLNFTDRVIEMNNENRISTYKIIHRTSTVTLGTFIGQVTAQATSVRALCIQWRDKANNPKNLSPIRSFVEKLTKRESLAQYQYFSDTEMSDISDDDTDTAARVKFWGVDELWGKVHSNTEIWIQNATPAGQTPVNPDMPGYPIFHAKVTTHKKFKFHPTGENLVGYLSESELDDIFTAEEDPAYQEEVPEIIYEPDATLIKKNGYKPYGTNAGIYNNMIFKLNISGTSIETEKLDFTGTHTDTFVVYKVYPDAYHPVQFGNPNSYYIKDSLWTNTVTFRDTIWTGLGNLPTGGSIYIPAETWVQTKINEDGSETGLHGKLTLGTAKNAYITGNILYQGTVKGNYPDDETTPNRTDYFGLVSEGKIIIKYKYRRYENNKYVTYYNNAQGPNGHVYLYGAYAAIGANGTDPVNGFKEAGTFTYEYQHPHGAVMPYKGVSQFTGADTLYKFIDFHRHQFPPMGNASTALWKRWPNAGTATHGYPGDPRVYGDYTLPGTAPMYNTSDWPWYNPVWPEKDAGATPANPNTDIAWERGTLHVYGAIAQRRRGFIHRSGNGGSDNPDVGVWALPYIFGPAHLANGYGGTGYQKDYHYDNRFKFVQPPDYPEIYQGSTAGMLSAFEDTSWDFKVPPKHNNNF